MKSEIKPKDLELLEAQTMYIAMVVRNAMENFHHRYLSDAQMKELNPIIRNAVFTALYAHKTVIESERSMEFMKYHIDMIPKYWEKPELLKGFKKG
jgi:hypothetical protein